MFALVDCNNFYASCERVFNPNLREKPVVVLSNNDGCVIARSNEAKAVGIPMGAPAFQYQSLFEQQNVHVFSANFALYGDMSMRVMQILSGFAPDIEIYSIDEAFLDFSGFRSETLEKIGQEMVYKVFKSTGIPISVGFAPTKALAKVANRIAKKFPERTNHVYLIDSEEKRIKALKWLKVEDIWGIGRRFAKKLHDLRVTTAWEFTQLNGQYVHRTFQVVGLRLQRELQGIPTRKLDEVQAKKNIATTRSFEKNYHTFEELKERIATFSVLCAEKLRRQHSACQTVLVFLQSNRFRKDLPQYNKSIVVSLPFATNSSIEITHFALQGLRKITKEGISYKKAGVIVMDFIPENQSQYTLFQQSNPKHKALMQAMDYLNKSIGQQKIKLAIQDKDRVWKMKQEQLSPRYTTRLKEIITIQAQESDQEDDTTKKTSA